MSSIFQKSIEVAQAPLNILKCTLGSRCEINHLRTLLENPRGTGADRQVAVYQQAGSRDAVIQQTMQGIPLEGTEDKFRTVSSSRDESQPL